MLTLICKIVWNEQVLLLVLFGPFALLGSRSTQKDSTHFFGTWYTTHFVCRRAEVIPNRDMKMLQTSAHCMESNSVKMVLCCIEECVAMTTSYTERVMENKLLIAKPSQVELVPCRGKGSLSQTCML